MSKPTNQFHINPNFIGSKAIENYKPRGGRRTYISLFSSAGVGCYGFKQQGFECIATNELLPQRLDVQRANNKCRYESGYILGDITEEDTKARLFREIDYWKDFEGLEEVDVVFATPPCQGMSTANYKKTADEQIRNSLVVEAIKLIKDIQPKIFIIENVRAFLSTVCTDISGANISIKDSIWRNLGNEYHIYAKVMNFKDYGIPSSRPRTIVIGTRKNLLNIAPLNLFPVRQREITLKDAIGHLPSLAFGEKDGDDALHFARPFPEYMIPWIEKLVQGQSAFQQDENRRPYKTDRQGNRIPLKGAYMGNKYRRLFWDKPCACIATRNDQLASQDTIHPQDNRVLSIRELMSVMTIPATFKWTADADKITPSNSSDFLKKHELNIRRCIGEAVPTKIISQIATEINRMLDFEDFVNTYEEGTAQELLEGQDFKDNFYIHTFLQEQLSENAKATGTFYTPQSVVFDAIKNLDADKDSVSVLEPSVGLGAFIPQLCRLFSDSGSLKIDAVEISRKTIATLRRILPYISLGVNVDLTFFCTDFLNFNPQRQYDVVVSNPPYAKWQSKSDRLQKFKTKNLFALFMATFKDYADNIICIIPKNFILADEYSAVRQLYEELPIVSISDYGVHFFKKVFVEIIAIHFMRKYTGNLTVTDYVNNNTHIHRQGYIYHDKVWLLYRDEWFDSFIRRLRLDVFESFRDRQITNSMLHSKGRIWVLKSKNILDDGSIVHKAGYDKYIDHIDNLAVARFYGSKAIIMPSFTYNTRAAILPDGCIPNGSIAVLTPKDSRLKIDDLGLYATDDFRRYYGIVKSLSKFTLNIDKSSIYYIGIPNDTF